MTGFASLREELLVTKEIDNLLDIVDDYQSRIFSGEGITEDDWNRRSVDYSRGSKSADVVAGALVTEGKTSHGMVRLQSGLQNLVQTLGSTPGYEELAAGQHL